MTDKVQKIREEVEKIAKSINPFLPDEDGKNSEYEAGRFAMVTQIMQIIDSLQEESVSKVWHNMDEVPIKGKVIVVQTKDTFYGISVQKGGTTYKNKNKDRYVRWAYASDLLKLSNVERTVKNWKEPVSEDLPHIRHRDTLDEFAYQCAYDMSNDWAIENPTWHDVEDACKLGAKWQKEQMMANAVERKVLVSPCGIPCIDATELYDYDDDKVKVIIIKED